MYLRTKMYFNTVAFYWNCFDFLNSVSKVNWNFSLNCVRNGFFFFFFFFCLITLIIKLLNCANSKR